MESGIQLGHYQILSPLGRGGMGEVWQARDTKLGRDVAIKTLPEQFARNEERLARFAREAKLLASLNHPGIAAIYGLEEHNGTRFLVLELVPGETLASRLERGAMTVGESLEIARQIAQALEAAHDKNVIHRDLKPANIKVTDENKVKVLDFGLAKVLDDVSTETGVSNSPTISLASTAQGMILGTTAYMSPEQAKGKEADRSSDLWAFGCVLYEMLTGRAVFEGENVHEILHGVLKVEPEWSRLPAETPVGIRSLLRRCLRKDSRLRLRDARDARLEIEEAQSAPPVDGQVTPKAARRRERLMGAALALVTLIAAVQSLRVWRPVPTAPSAPEMRLEISTPATTDPVSLAISPDGQKIVFVATSEGRPHLWLGGSIPFRRGRWQERNTPLYHSGRRTAAR
jgi:eukaryotic-like serine/threonine-protein kinase